MSRLTAWETLLIFIVTSRSHPSGCVDRVSLLPYHRMLAVDSQNRITLSDTPTVVFLAPVAHKQVLCEFTWLKAHQAVKFGITWSDKECYREILA